MKNEPPGNIYCSLLYLIGSICFLLGSIAFLPKLYQHSIWQYIGGISFTIGAIFFCIIDGICIRLLKLKGQQCLSRIYQGCGSLFYLIGSILFIPGYIEVTLGNLMFIIGSVIFLSTKIWLYYQTKFKFNNILVSIIVFQIIATLSFLIGPILQKFKYELQSLWIYIIGSIGFVIASILSILYERQKLKKQTIDDTFQDFVSTN